MTIASAATGVGVVVRPEVRKVMRALRPSVWPVLLDVALDAEWRDGHLVASTSARLVADHLRIDPGTAAAGLRALREHGLVELTQVSGANGRFGLAIYTLHLPDSIRLLSAHPLRARKGTPRTEEPCTEKPHAERTREDSWLVLWCPPDSDSASLQRDRTDMVHPPATAGHESAHQPTDSPTRIEPWPPPMASLIDAASPTTAAGGDTATPRSPVPSRGAVAKPSFEQGVLDLETGG